MPKTEFSPKEGLFPVPVVLVSSIDKTTGAANIITIAWCGVICSNPPMLSVSIRPSRHSHRLIKDAGDFVVNIPDSAMLKKVDLCGIRSGKDTDKFKECAFTRAPSVKVASPAIKECPVNIECKLKEIISLGTHDMFIGEVILIHADNNILTPKRGIDYAKASPFVFNQGEYWSLGKRIGYYGFSAK
ncbi:MAG: flavin reductase family protein [Candidatus Omnitrophica bacterium]|nr:flavin reductase family protein [Candidatus Omnitrophota bacterium]